MPAKPADCAEHLLRMHLDSPDERTRKVALHVVNRRHIARPPLQGYDATSTPGQRAADAVAGFGGSWTFIAIFAVVLVAWVIVNSLVLAGQDKAFDPYPYVFLNLILSMLAAVQAPVILMSQNRQGEKDRVNAESDYAINLKAELEIMLLHEKVDYLREKQRTELIEMQHQQLALLANLLEKNGRAGIHTERPDQGPIGRRTIT